MFYRYEIRNNGIEDILYLYLDMRYEFSDELFRDEKDLSRRTINFINSNKINFKGKKVYLIVNDIVVKTVDVSKSIIKNYLPSNKYSSNNFTVNIKLDDNSFCEISLREYLLSILFNNYSSSFNLEVYKCICILFTTYAYKMMKNYAYIEADSVFSKYIDSKSYKNKYSNYDKINSILNNVIDEVDSVFMMFENDYILPFIHYSNSGKTLANINYPYLSSVKCLWDLASPYYVNIYDYSYEELKSKLKITINNINNISYDSLSKRINIDGNIFSIEEIKSTLNIISNDLSIIVYHNYIRFICKGFGNSYGLSIYSANEMANNGSKYITILNYFFPKVKIFRYIKELSK